MKIFAKTVVLFALLGQFCVPTFAEDNATYVPEIPFSKSNYYHFAKDQKLADLIRDFCSMQGISVVVSQNVNETVNGKFSKMAPSDFWNYISRAYGLSWFYDGKILYVYAGNEIQTKIFRMNSEESATLSNIIATLGFVSSDFSFRSVGDANILLVTAPPRFIEVVDDLSSKFAVSRLSDSTIVKTFQLKYAWAYDMTFNYRGGTLVVPGVATLMRNILTGNQMQTTMTMSTSVGATSATKMTDLNVQSPNPYSPDRSNTSVNINTGGQNNNSQDSKDSKTDGSKDILNVQVPGTITYDPRLNAIIIRDKKENMAFYEDIITQLDVSCDVIKIDVAIVDVSKNDGVDIGIDALKISKSGSGEYIASPAGNKSSTFSGQDASNIFSNITHGVVNGYQIAGYFQALQNNGKAKTIARPSVLTLDNVGAIIERDNTLYVKVQGFQSEGLYDVTASTKLQVVPHVIPGERNAENKKKMKLFVDVTDSALSSQSQTDKTVDPSVDANSINTQAVLYEGQCLLIGGYFREEHTDSTKGVPILSSIPIVGTAFAMKSKAASVVERIYVIFPSIIDPNNPNPELDKYFAKSNLDGKSMFDWPSNAKKQKKSTSDVMRSRR